MGLPSYKFTQTLDDRIQEATLLKYGKTRQPITNKKLLASLGIDDFIDRMIYNYKKDRTQKQVDEFNLYMKSRYQSLVRRGCFIETKRKVNF